jgi:hypothetical protein
MALEALRDVMLQAGRDFFNTRQRDRLIAEERQREDEVYRRRLADQIEAEGRAEARMISAEGRANQRMVEAEGRAEGRTIAAELRAIDNEIARMERIDPVRARMAIRQQLAVLTQNPAVLDESKYPDETLRPMYAQVLRENKGLEIAAELQARTDTWAAAQGLDDKQKLDARNTLYTAYQQLKPEAEAAARALTEMRGNAGAEYSRIAKQLASEVVAANVGAPNTPERKAWLAERGLPDNASDEAILSRDMVSLGIFNQQIDKRAKFIAENNPEVAQKLANFQLKTRQLSDLETRALDLGVNLRVPREGQRWFSGSAAPTPAPATVKPAVATIDTPPADYFGPAKRTPSYTQNGAVSPDDLSAALKRPTSPATSAASPGAVSTAPVDAAPAVPSPAPGKAHTDAVLYPYGWGDRGKLDLPWLAAGQHEVAPSGGPGVRANEAIADRLRGAGYWMKNMVSPSSWGLDNGVLTFDPGRPGGGYLPQLESRLAAMTDRSSPRAMQLQALIEYLRNRENGAPGYFGN